MRIDLNPAAQALSENHRSGAAGTTATGNSATSHAATGGLGEEDQAELCRAHAQVQALVAQAAQLPDVREERVQALRQAIQRGYYQSSPEEVAGAVFAHMIAGPAA
jgi:flagellar biosynthesis anti-sigma factor FlgM